jgi:type IX secretion system PorP/SprF family membrane protein
MKLGNKSVGLILTLLLANISISSYSQTDSNIAHFWSNRNYFTPAYVVPMLHASLLQRGQQLGFDGQPFTSVGHFSWYKPKWRSLFGVQLQYDYAGYTSVAKIGGRYAYSLGPDDNRVNFGLQVGISYLHYDESKVKADDMNDLSLFENNNIVNPNYNFGVEWVHKVSRFSSERDEFTLGFSMLNMEDYLNRQRYRNTINELFLYSSYRFQNLSLFDFYGGVMGRYYDMNRLQIELHASAIYTGRHTGNLEDYDRVAIGFSYRHNAKGAGMSDIIINAGVSVTKHFYIGYSFDLVVQDDLKRPYSSHEIMLEYKFKNRKCMADQSSYILLGGK